MEELAFQFDLDLARKSGRIVDCIDLGDGWMYFVEEYLELEVDYTLAPAEIRRRAGLDERDWEHVGTVPSANGKRKVKLAIGYLNRQWAEYRLHDLLAKPGCKLAGSGAWVREAYRQARPNYDGKGPIAFPDKETSRWRGLRFGGLCFLCLWLHDVRPWYQDLRHNGYEWSVAHRLCLVVREQ